MPPYPKGAGVAVEAGPLRIEVVLVRTDSRRVLQLKPCWSKASTPRYNTAAASGEKEQWRRMHRKPNLPPTREPAEGMSRLPSQRRHHPSPCMSSVEPGAVLGIWKPNGRDLRQFAQQGEMYRCLQA